MELQRSKPSRLLCSCGKPLDRFGTVEALPQLPRAALRKLGDGRHTQVGSSSGDLPQGGDPPRTRWRCRRCRANVVITGARLQDAYRAAAAAGRSDVVVGIDV